MVKYKRWTENEGTNSQCPKKTFEKPCSRPYLPKQSCICGQAKVRQVLHNPNITHESNMLGDISAYSIQHK